MSGKMNKFMKQLEINSSVKTSTDEIVERLYEEDIEEKKVTVGTSVSEAKKPVKNEKKSNKKVGRPKERTDEKYLQIHIILPESLKKEIQKAIICHRTNMNSYLIELIKADLDKNGSDYDKIYESISKIAR